MISKRIKRKRKKGKRGERKREGEEKLIYRTFLVECIRLFHQVLSHITIIKQCFTAVCRESYSFTSKQGGRSKKVTLTPEWMK